MFVYVYDVLFACVSVYTHLYVYTLSHMYTEGWPQMFPLIVIHLVFFIFIFRY